MPESNEIMSVEGQLIGMPLAGPESFSQQQLDYLKRALGVDETVLSTTTYVMSNNPTITLSEPAWNFEFVDIYVLPHNTNNVPIVLRFVTGGLVANNQGSITVQAHAGGGGIRLNNGLLTISSSGNLVITESKQFSIVGTTVSQGTAASTFVKVVGIHRIAGGN